jgi:Fic family protein
MALLKHISISPEVLLLISQIDEKKGAWNAAQVLSSADLERLKKISFIESVAASCRIEGSTLSSHDVSLLLENNDLHFDDAIGKAQVLGLAKVMDLIYTSWEDITITESHIQQLHKELLSFSEKDAWHRGKYKTNANSVVAFDSEGKQVGVVFQTASAFDTPLLMAELVQWFNYEKKKRALHPLIITAIFTVVFLEIHPFQDGNGRLSRVLTSLMLLQFGYAFVPYASLENIIEQSKDAYYLALRNTQITIRSEAQNWEPWLVFFLHALVKQTVRLTKKVEREKLVFSAIPLLSLNILEFVKEHGRVSIGDMVQLTGVSRNTLKIHFRSLVEKGFIEQRGGGRSTWYVLR